MKDNVIRFAMTFLKIRTKLKNAFPGRFVIFLEDLSTHIRNGNVALWGSVMPIRISDFAWPACKNCAIVC
jgi:hypothetical protein